MERCLLSEAFEQLAVLFSDLAHTPLNFGSRRDRHPHLMTRAVHDNGAKKIVQSSNYGAMGPGLRSCTFECRTSEQFAVLVRR